MNRDRFILCFLVAVFLLSFLIFAGCASTSKNRREEAVSGDSANIDELLGLVEEDTQKKSNETLGEDDVLRLLGVGEKGDSKAVKSDTGAANLQQKLNTLEAENKSTEAEKNKLQNIVNTQEKSISNLNSATADKTTPVSWKGRSFADRYQEALQTYRSRHFMDAIQKFENLLDSGSYNSLSDNCQYWIGECYYGLGKYEEAALSFEKVFSFSNSNKDDDAQLKLGLCQLRLNNKAKAKEEFQKLVDNYPTSEYVSVAQRFIAQIK